MKSGGGSEVVVSCPVPQNPEVVSLQVSLNGRSQGSTFITPNEKRRERKLCWEEREFPGISMEFQDRHCGTMACVCARHGVLQSAGCGLGMGGLPLPKSRLVKTHMVGFLPKWKYLVWSSLSGRQHLEVVKVQRRWKGSAVWHGSSEPGVPLSRTG